MPKQKDNDTMEFEDSENFSASSEGLTIKLLIMEQLRRCMIEGSKEMHDAGVRQRIIDGMIISVPVPNQREIYCNAVENLWVLIRPIIDKHPELVEKHLGDFEEEIKKLKEDYKLKNVKAEVALFNQMKRQSQQAINRTTNDYKEQNRKIYEFSLVDLYRKRLTAISFILSAVNYFDEQGAMGG